MAKKKKPKVVTGWLCRDRNIPSWMRDDVEEVLLYLEPELTSEGIWQGGLVKGWSPAKFAATYDFPLPARGTKVYVEIEL